MLGGLKKSRCYQTRSPLRSAYPPTPCAIGDDNDPFRRNIAAFHEVHIAGQGI